MLRRVALSTTSSAALVGQQNRGVRTSTMRETMTPIPGHHAGMQNVMNEVAINPDHDEERKRPVFRMEVTPKRDEHSYLATMYKWGYNSLTLFLKVNEDPGPWWNANSSTLSSNWSTIGDFAICGMWTGIWRFTYGTGLYNLRPSQLYGMAFGTRNKDGALVVDYKETITGPAQQFMMPHTKEHDVHKRFKSPEHANTKTMDSIFGKRVLRECQYHLGQSLRFYLVDGYFGSHPSTSTAFRIFTDNASHGYLASMSAVRQLNITCMQEIVLSKRVNHAPLDEWAWRRPPVILFHCPGYDFEIPRIVEEFGGPRPQDLGLASPKFILTDPYSIPMKAMMGAEPKSKSIFDTIGFLCGRWGYYADDREYLTLANAESVINASTGDATVFVHDGSCNVDAIRNSSLLWGTQHHRLAEGMLSRCWDSTAIAYNNGKTKTHALDYIETSTDTVYRPLPTRVGAKNAAPGNSTVSHRFRNKRNIHNYGYKWAHNHTNDVTARAASAGMLFKTKDTAVSRPSAYESKNAHFVFLEEGKDGNRTINADEAAKLCVANMQKGGWLYAEPEKLITSFATAFGNAGSLQAVGSNSAAAAVNSLASKGSL